MNGSRFSAVLGQDLSHNTRRPLYWMLVLLIVLTTWGLSGGQVTISSGDSNVGGLKAFVTSEFANAQLFSLLTLLFYGFFISVAAGTAVIQDHEFKVNEVLHSTPLRPGEYVWGKFLAVMLSFAVLLGVHVASSAFFNHVIPNAAAREVHGPFALMNYVLPALVFALPTLVFVGGIAFAVGVWSRKTILVFVLPVALVLLCGFFLWDWAPSWLDPRMNRVLQAIDPTGFRWLNETWLKVDRGVQFYNQQPVGLDALFLWNRLGVIVLGIGSVALSLRSYARSVRGADTVVSSAEAIRARTGAPAPRPVATPRPLAALGMTAAPTSFLVGLVAVSRVEVRELFSQPGLYIFIPMILLQTLGTTLTATGPFDTPLLTTSGYMAVRAMGPLTTMLCLLLLFYTVEAVERERSTGLSSIFRTTPISTGAMLGGKVIASALIGVAVILATLAGCLIAALIQGRVPFDIGPFALIWGAGMLPTLLLWSAFLMAVLALTGNRYSTYAIGLLTLIVSGYLNATGRINWASNWTLWRTLRWSDISVMELDRTAFILNRLAALGLAVFFTAFTVRLWPRRDEDAVTAGARLEPGNLLRGLGGLAPYLVVPVTCVVILGYMVHSGSEGGTNKKLLKDYWRKNVNTWKDAPAPGVTRTEVKLRLDPARRYLRVDGSYSMVNLQGRSMAKFPVTGGSHWEHLKWTLDGAPYQPEDRKGLFIFTPKNVLQPGDSVRMGFSFDGYFPKGISRNGGGREEFILPSGVVLTGFTPSFVPVLGFMDGVGVDKDNHSDARVYPDNFYEGVTDPGWGYGKPFKTRIEVTGPAEYTYNSVGTLTRNQVRGKLRTQVWESDAPVVLFNVVAGRWKVKRAPGTAVFYDPAHPYNVDEILDGLGQARRYYSEWFAPYPWKELKISEFPGLAAYAQGFPSNIPFSENIGFLAKSDPRANVAFMVTAHESAHQWWGNIVVPARGPGADILSEGMAHFSTLLLFEQVKGIRQRIEFARNIEKRYNDRRQVDSEQPLVKIDGTKNGDQTVTYDKGGWVTWMLLNHMGRERALTGIRAFIAEYRDNSDHPVLQDFVATMRPFAADTVAYDAFVKQWYFSVVVPEYKLDEARSTARAGGWDVTVKVRNAGTSRMPVQVAAFAGERFPDEQDARPVAKSGRAGGGPRTSAPYRDSRETVTLGAGEAKLVRIHCPFKPEKITVDPDALVLQLNRKQAVVSI